MKLTKYIYANILSLFGLLGCCSLLLLVGDVFDIYSPYASLQYWIIDSPDLVVYILFWLLVFIILEIIINKIVHRDGTVNFRIKNEEIKQIYNILFWFGIFCCISYMLIYVWVITR